MFITMAKTYKIGKLVESIIDKVNKSEDFNVELNVIDDNTITVTVQKLGIDPEEMNCITIRR